MMDEARLKEFELHPEYGHADHKEVADALREAWRERDGGLVGTSNCPICGKNTPHHHSAEPAERGDLLPTIKHALNELQMSGESSRLASNEIYPYAIGWLWYLVKRADRAEADVERLESELSRLEETIGVYLNAPAEDLRRALRRALDACEEKP